MLAAAAPGVVLAGHDLTTAQHRVDSSRLASSAAVLAHDLADERDDLAGHVAGGRSGALPDADRARTDRQLGEVTAGAPAGLKTTLARLAAVRQQAMAGSGGPGAVVAAYQPLIDALDRLAGPATGPLSRAVTAAGVQRGLLVAALTGSGDQAAPVSAAQTARVQEQAALTEFRAIAAANLRDRYDRTVTGPDAARADHDLGILLSAADLTPAGRALGAGEASSALTARLDLMRGVQTSALADEERAAHAHRSHVVTVLELRAALGLLCLVLLTGVLVTLFRTLTRPLAALHAWSKADPASGTGARVVGADEFADVARRVNALTHETQALRTRVTDLAAERTAAAEAGSALTAEHEALLRTRDELLRTQGDLLRSREELAGRLARATARTADRITYVNLGLRTLGLIERQLALIESLEDHEQDPDRLGTLFKLDHLATRMRRNSENLLVLTGTEHSHGAAARPVELIDVARAALSEIEPYERVRVQSVPEGRVTGRGADDVSHLVAELLDNAAAFSDPASDINLSGHLLPDGKVLLSVEDSGIGIPPERMAVINVLLADPDPDPPGATSGMGLYVVARLAHRHGVQVRLAPRTSGGITATVVLPLALLPDAAPAPHPARAAAPVTYSIAPEATPEHVTHEPAAADPEPVAVPHRAGARHERAAQHEPHGPAPVPAQRAQPPAMPVPPLPPVPTGPGGEPLALTAKGLPQRVPRATGLSGEPAARNRPSGGVDADALRRKLAGLQQGLRDGRRDAEHEAEATLGDQALPARPAPGAEPLPVRRKHARAAVPAQETAGPGPVSARGVHESGAVPAQDADGPGAVAGPDPHAAGTVSGADGHGFGTVPAQETAGPGPVSARGVHESGAVPAQDADGPGAVAGPDPHAAGTVLGHDRPGRDAGAAEAAGPGDRPAGTGTQGDAAGQTATVEEATR
ncbi:nitrate- and nitrite sensing domain-containing protein [Streptomyces sp. KK5PA1]|uniref:histidine kinase n=1 Tax=Actinacidiphila acididurans TaxID=2784346 RepID=A0ABS2TJX3_9ACTN|nr:nitrate- and nitrite sensing domain-containing protein [Actinacidiphila acididurans]